MKTLVMTPRQAYQVRLQKREADLCNQLHRSGQDFGNRTEVALMAMAECFVDERTTERYLR